MSRAAKDVVQQIQINRQAQQTIRTGGDPRQRRTSSGNLGGGVENETSHYNPAPPGAKMAAAALAPGQPSETELYSTLKNKVEQQRVELTNRTDNVNAIQRNFQRLSEMYSQDREKLEETERKLKAALDELDALRSEKKIFDTLKREFMTLKQKHVALEQEQAEGGSALQGEMRDLRKQLIEITAERDMMQRAVAECGDRIQYDEAVKERVNTGVQRIEQEVTNLFAAVIDLQKATGEEENVGNGVGLETFVNSMSGQTANGSSVEFRLERLWKAVQLCTQKAVYPLVTKCGENLRTLKEDWEKECNRICGERDAASVDLKATKDAYLKLEADHDALQAKVREMATKFSAEKNAMQMKIEELDALVKASDSSADERLEMQREAAAKVEAQLAQVQEELRVTVEKLQQANASKEAMQKELDATKARTQELESEKQQLASSHETELAAKQKLISELTASIEQQKKNIADLKKVHEGEVQQVRKHLEGQIDDLKKQLQLRPTTTDTEAALRQASDATRQVQNQLEALRAKYAQLEQDYDKAINQLTETSAEKTTLTIRCEELEKRLSGAGNSESSLRAKLDLAEGENTRLKEDNEAAEDEIERLKKEKVEVNQALRDMSQKKLELEISLQSIRKELQAAKEASAAASTTAESVGSLQAALTSVRADLKAANERYEAEKQKVADLRVQKDRAEGAAREAKRFSDELLASQDSILKQRMELEQRAVKASERAQQIRLVQEESAKAVKKLLKAEQACESGYSCQNCMELFKDPVICGPCGHCFCSKCAPKKDAPCFECDREVDAIIPVKSLDLLAGKFTYRCGVLNDLLSLVEKDLAKPVE